MFPPETPAGILTNQRRVLAPSKMAPLPASGNEPKSPSLPQKGTFSSNDMTSEENAATSNQAANDDSGIATDIKQVNKENPDVTNLNDGQLKALLDEALTYKCPKDRMGKSSLFCELLDKAESDKQECGDDRLGSQADSSSTRFFNRRRGNATRRDASAATSGETKGGSLQNLVASNEFDHFYTIARGRRFRRGGKDYGVVSVSARQREGGSLPSNVNVGGCPSMKTHIEELRDYVPPRNRREVMDNPKSDECLSARGDEGSECHKGVQTNECTMIDMEHLGNCEGYAKKERGFGDNGDAMCEEGTEMGMIRGKFTTRATLEVGHGDRARHVEHDVQVDAPLFIPIGSTNEVKVNGEGVAAQMSLQYVDERPKSRGVPIPYPILNKWLNHGLFVEVGESLHEATNKTSISHPHHVSEFSIPAKTRGSSHHWIDTQTRIPSANPEDKARVLDENGNALNASERKKLRKAKPKPNYTEIKSETVAGHCGDKNIDDLLKFIESDKEQKSKIRSNQRLMHDKTTDKRRDRKLTKSEDDNSLDNDKIKRSNSLEEVSKTKMEDLTVEASGVIRRPKKQSTFDNSDLRGDRRSWGTEEGQQYYCTDPSSADETFPSRSAKKRKEDEAKATDEFHVVSTKKQRRKKRSSSGGRKPSAGQRETNQPRRGNVHNFPPHDRDVICTFHGSLSSSEQQRRKSTSSMPPSDKSDASDLDSVHSLPVSSTSPKTMHDSSSSSAPLVSYADIAKISSVAVNINVNATKWPAIGAQFITTSKVNIGVPPVSGSKLYANSVSKSNDNVAAAVNNNNNAEGSPPKPRLETRPKKNAVTKPTVIKTVILSYQVDDKSLVTEDPPTAEGEVVENAMNSIALVDSDVVRSVSLEKCLKKKARPPVIIMNESEAQDNSSGDELTFGFEVNELLLMSDEVEHSEANINNAYNHVEVSFGFELADSKEQAKSDEPESSHISWSDEVDEEVPLAENFDWSSWYREPTELSPPEDHHSLVDYIGSAWEAVKRSGLLTYHSDLDGHIELQKQLTNA